MTSGPAVTAPPAFRVYVLSAAAVEELSRANGPRGPREASTPLLKKFADSALQGWCVYLFILSSGTVSSDKTLTKL